ncbi:bifunctional phosphoribosylaminoimidazolecarboxamide formyltransferase/IMP cyclohydrolase [Desulfosporosinus sp. BICA1-9]|uniref:bifunctional phosphoribosylaminoimidazolecarboxamide formyltransferase/IMP cyclohydrolase n=1 Tax=Desulfosporosinus sp. BICA1-9 TaxID=1531958 RepID=UPI00054BD196|nr:bifunctional phosphoribosylaminoimidazolecarboxamide formyltransferase/IMP cyclohydrolase [Desulfosporosinus sp. BICA1-9]KJS49763.1 MAG: phosphoribosylaminoimidazolecarboxamide formyltransferase [Peptococcaceae bacterium BRH_c23]KJS90180.1 MAG: phosphoribosylaminoimidazolecarboxamide formyltransferase [Desulfosporosinus sp. BICA1-9]HBW38954.1 bifunctional phosphoribosylaminoimidazolecarboxamide formyltransferase/IMP cyclohydrolase PurH [Desulfosporosinus sp.]
MKRRAIISVSDKTGIVVLARELVDLGFELISTGGTYKTLDEANIPVNYVSEVTGFPEVLDGRVKTLHPLIHGGILARDCREHMEQMEQNGIRFIDLVVVNLYPFRETIAKPGVTFEEAIENIDVGGPTMVRAAAKNHGRVIVVVNPESYEEVISVLRETGTVSAGRRRRLAAEAFAHTAEYDRLIAGYLERQLEPTGSFPETLRLTAQKVQELRYGENPQQKAAFYVNSEAGEGSLANGKQLQGKELSYNNWNDMDAAWKIVHEFDTCTAAIIKHSNPCGVASGKTPLEAYESAYAADPMSAFGGIVAFNRVVETTCAEALQERFYEVIIAPEFSPEAREILSAKQNLRLFVVGRGDSNKTKIGLKSIDGGYLVQEIDRGTASVTEWDLVTDHKPTEEDLQALDFAWRVVKHVKSNAIVVTDHRRTLGVGAGQMNRVGSVKIALDQAGDSSKGAYLASDAFFPFPDSIEEAAKAGIRAIVQPGGSLKDAAVIEAANRLNIIMVFTHRRHFQH